MSFDKDKVHECTLALLYLAMHNEDKYGARAWKGFDWETMNRLHDKGYIDNPVGKAKSVYIFPEGVKKAKELFLQISNGTFFPYGHRLFSIDDIRVYSERL